MNFKGLMLAAAAATAATGASAADLPVAPEPVDYVKVCDAYGARFYYIPGTDTCLRVGGRVRVQVATGNFASEDGNDFSSRELDDFSYFGRGYLYLDSRTSTEFGLLRTYAEFQGNGGAGVVVDKAFIQWGGLTAGYATSFFDFFTGQSYIGPVTRNWSDQTTTLIAYTAAFGNGFSATISVEDSEKRRANGNGFYGAGNHLPDLVANLRVDQGWGSAQLSGALHEVYASAAQAALGADNEFGWAIQGGVIINLPMLSSSSNIAFQAAYADGALSYLGGGAYSDASLGANGDTSDGWNIGAGIYHQMGAIGVSLDGSYLDIDVADSANDITRWAIDGSIKWAPVSGLDMGIAVGYANTDIDNGADTDELKAAFRIQRTF